MQLFIYHIQTKYGSAEGSLEAKDEDAARGKLAAQYDGELADEDGNPLNNDVESIELEKVPYGVNV